MAPSDLVRVGPIEPTDALAVRVGQPVAERKWSGLIGSMSGGYRV
jgi:hypothetical protein